MALSTLGLVRLRSFTCLSMMEDKLSCCRVLKWVSGVRSLMQLMKEIVSLMECFMSCNYRVKASMR